MLINPCKMATPQEKTQCVSWFIETKSDVQTQQKYRAELSKLSMDKIHHHVLQFIDGTRNL